MEKEQLMSALGQCISALATYRDEQKPVSIEEYVNQQGALEVLKSILATHDDISYEYLRMHGWIKDEGVSQSIETMSEQGTLIKALETYLSEGDDDREGDIMNITDVCHNANPELFKAEISRFGFVESDDIDTEYIDNALDDDDKRKLLDKWICDGLIELDEDFVKENVDSYEQRSFVINYIEDNL